MPYDIREYDTLEAFADVADAWDACVQDSPWDSMFLTSAWLTAWWRAHGVGHRMRIVCAFAGGVLVAGAPLCSRRSRYYLVPVRELRFIGDGAADRQDFPVRPGHQSAVAVIWERLRHDLRGCHIVRLEEIPADSESLATGLRVWDRLVSEPSSELPYLSVATTWEDYESTLPRKFCSEMRTRVKQFDHWGAWEYQVVEGDAILEQFDEVVAVEAASHKLAAQRAFFAHAGNREFIDHLLRAPGAIRPVLFTLRSNGELISYILGFVYGGVYHAYNGAYRSGFEKGSVGKWVFHQSVKHAFDSGLRGFDFLRGATYMKTRWRPDLERRHARAVGFAPGLLGDALRFAVFHARPRLKAWWLSRRASG